MKLFSDSPYAPRTKDLRPIAPEPDPYRFSILAKFPLNGHTIILAYYSGCTTFNGKKLLLWRGPYTAEKKYLDPHLLGNNHRVIARFEPTMEGMELACTCALQLKPMQR